MQGTEDHAAVSLWPRSLVSEGSGSARYERYAAHPISALTGTTRCQKVVLTVSGLLRVDCSQVRELGSKYKWQNAEGEEGVP